MLATLGLESHGNGQETEDSGHGASHHGLGGSIAVLNLHARANKSAVDNGHGSILGSAVSGSHNVLGLALGNVANPAVGDIGGQNLGMDRADHILKDSIVLDNSASEPVTTIVRVHKTILTENSLVLQELEVGISRQLVVVQEGGHVSADHSFINDYIHSLDGVSEIGSAGEGGGLFSVGAVEEGGTSIVRQDLLVRGRRDGPGSSVVVVGGGSDIRGPGNDGLGGLAGGVLLEAVVVVVNGGGQVLGRLLQVEESRVELEPLSTLI